MHKQELSIANYTHLQTDIEKIESLNIDKAR